MTISARLPTPASWRKDQRALDAVEAEREELDNFVAEIKVSEVGKDALIRGKNAKQAKLDLARAELKATAAPAPEPTPPPTGDGQNDLGQAAPNLRSSSGNFK